MSQFPHDYTGPHYGAGPHPFDDPQRTMHDPARQRPDVDPNTYRYEDDYRHALRQAEEADHWNAVAQREHGGQARPGRGPDVPRPSGELHLDVTFETPSASPSSAAQRSWWTHTSDGREVNRWEMLLPALIVGTLGGCAAAAVAWFVATVLFSGGWASDGSPAVIPMGVGGLVGLGLFALLMNSDPKP